MRELGLENNLLEEIPEGAFVSLVGLKKLNLSSNRIHSIGDYWFNEDNTLKEKYREIISVNGHVVALDI